MNSVAAGASTGPEDLNAPGAVVERFRRICDRLLPIVNPIDGRPLQVVDIGCGTGIQCELWAGHGHVAHGLDVDASLIDIARSRDTSYGRRMEFRVGSADALPWLDASMDVC